MLNAMTCPRCGGELKRSDYGGKICFRCSAGHGVCMTVSGLRSLCGNAGFANTLWMLANQQDEYADAPCPVCGKKMKKIHLPLAEGSLELDVCCPCQTIWFDPHELEALPLPQPVPQDELPPKAKEILALRQIEKVKEMSGSSRLGDAEPSERWKILPALFGFPVEQDAPEMNSRPWITWGLTLLCTVIFLCTFSDLRNIIQHFGLIPAEKWRLGGLTFLTSMFLHGGVGHIVGNMYFLLIFGDNVEDALGKRRYAGLIAASGLTASLIYILFRGSSTIPCVGASGFISGVIAAYAVTFPRVTLSFLFRPRYTFCLYWFGLPAWAAFGLWLAFQMLLAYLTAHNTGGGVAYTAHIGGAIPGLLLACYLRFRRKHAVEDFSKKLDDYCKVE
ncbi:MAG: rhomboid family intramembrane serine protease [Lentisphaeria bacterium]|nr:rhomboid family intramembrane serine protease [Lentisphaeria bacterium]